MKTILVKVRQGQLSPEQARNQIQDEYLKNRDGPNNQRFWPTEADEGLLSILETVQKDKKIKIITTNEAEEDIKQTIEEGIWKTRKKARIRKQAQIENYCT